MSDLTQRAARLQGARDKLLEQKAAKCKQLAALCAKADTYSEALHVIEQLAQGARQTTSDSVTAILSSAMRDIFGEDAGCLLEWVEVGERGDHRPRFLSWDQPGVAQDPMRGNGGSAADVIATALRIWFLVKLGGPRFLFLDEPLKGVDAKRSSKAAGWLQKLATDLQLQVIAISHLGPEDLEQAADHVLQVTREGLESTVHSAA